MMRALGDQYVLGDLIGSGGMGCVYSAEQPRLARAVAVKLMRPELVADTYMLRRFHTEASIGSQLRHPNLVAVLDYGVVDGVPYLVMERVDGQLLSELLVREGSLAPHRAARLVRELLVGLAAAHAARIVHADIKADNVIVSRGEPETVKLIDFGLACSLDETSPRTATLSGTPEYVAPELITGGQPSTASDVYAAGVVLYELLTGETPFSGGTVAATLASHLDDEVVPPSLRNPDACISLALEAVVMRALAKDPRDRYADATQFAAALAAAAPVGDAPVFRARTRPAFASETPTRDIPTRIRAAGTREHAAQPRLRDAILRGNVEQIVSAYLELARALVDEHRLDAAAKQLEEAVDVITAGGGVGAPDAPEPLWRVLLTLAAVYDGLGDRGRAVRAARAGQAHAIRCSSPVGRERAGTLIGRLGQRAA